MKWSPFPFAQRASPELFAKNKKKKKENRRGTQRHAKSNQCLQQTIYFRPYSATAMSPVSLMTSLLPLCTVVSTCACLCNTPRWKIFYSAMLHRLLLLTDGPSVVVYSRPTKDDIISQYINTDKRLGYLHFAALHMRTHFRSVVFRFNSIPWLLGCALFSYTYIRQQPPHSLSPEILKEI